METKIALSFKNIILIVIIKTIYYVIYYSLWFVILVIVLWLFPNRSKLSLSLFFSRVIVEKSIEEYKVSPIYLYILYIYVLYTHYIVNKILIICGLTGTRFRRREKTIYNNSWASRARAESGEKGFKRTSTYTKYITRQLNISINRKVSRTLHVIIYNNKHYRTRYRSKLTVGRTRARSSLIVRRQGKRRNWSRMIEIAKGR